MTANHMSQRWETCEITRTVQDCGLVEIAILLARLLRQSHKRSKALHQLQDNAKEIHDLFRTLSDNVLLNVRHLPQLFSM